MSVGYLWIWRAMNKHIPIKKIHGSLSYFRPMWAPLGLEVKIWKAINPIMWYKHRDKCKSIKTQKIAEQSWNSLENVRICTISPHTDNTEVDNLIDIFLWNKKKKQFKRITIILKRKKWRLVQPALSPTMSPRENLWIVPSATSSAVLGVSRPILLVPSSFQIAWIVRLSGLMN